MCSISSPPQVIARLKKLGEETAPPQTVRLLEEAMPLLLRLERALVEGEHRDQLFSLQLSLFEPILRVCREEEVRRFVTVDGA
ncbi:MAG: hypothetical protein HFF41_01325, partial [Lawsonibacter sp.]|nr:hypothetical protein [Lawsonibacter sp.]